MLLQCPLLETLSIRQQWRTTCGMEAHLAKCMLDFANMVGSSRSRDRWPRCLFTPSGMVDCALAILGFGRTRRSEVHALLKSIADQFIYSSAHLQLLLLGMRMRQISKDVWGYIDKRVHATLCERNRDRLSGLTSAPSNALAQARPALQILGGGQFPNRPAPQQPDLPQEMPRQDAEFVRKLRSSLTVAKESLRICQKTLVLAH